MSNKYTTIEQYFLDKMEILEQTNAELVNANRALSVEIGKLEEKLKTQVVHEVGSHYTLSTLHYYDFKDVENKEYLSKSNLEKCLVDNESLDLFIEKTYKDSNYGDGGFRVRENNHIAKLTGLDKDILIDIYIYNNGDYSVSTYVVDDKSCFYDKDLAYKQLQKEAKKQINYYLNYIEK